LRRKWSVYFHLFIAGCFSFRQRRIIEVWETDGALDLQRAAAREKNRRRMGIYPLNPGMRRRIGQKGKHALLVRCR
jgi:hypothetical protein